MRKSFWVLSLLLLASGAPLAHADSFTITLHDGTSTTVDGTGSFNFSGGTFSDFTITMFPGTATNADCQNGGSTPGDAWAYAGQDTAPAVLGFNTVVGNPIFASATGPHLGGQFDGDFVVTSPEPGVISLLLTALFALAFLVRKRNVRGLKMTP